MQASPITISVDAANDGNPADQLYSLQTYVENRSVYIGVNHVAEARNQLNLYRTFATKSGNFKGTEKTAAKFTQDVTVPGVDGSTTLTAPIILEVSFSVPVGTTDAALLEMRQRAVGLLDDDTFMDSFNKQLMI